MQQMSQWRPRTRACIAIWPQSSFSSCWTACWSLTTLPRLSTPTMSRGLYFGKQVRKETIDWKLYYAFSPIIIPTCTYLTCVCIFCAYSRFQRKVQTQPVEAGDQQSGMWAAHPVSYVHRWEPSGCLGGGPETTAQVRNKYRTYCVRWIHQWIWGWYPVGFSSTM